MSVSIRRIVNLVKRTFGLTSTVVIAGAFEGHINGHFRTSSNTTNVGNTGEILSCDGKAADLVFEGEKDEETSIARRMSEQPSYSARDRRYDFRAMLVPRSIFPSYCPISISEPCLDGRESKKISTFAVDFQKDTSRTLLEKKLSYG